MEKSIKDLIKQKEVEIIAIEELVVMRNASVIKALAGLQYHLLAEFRKREFLVVQVRPSEWRSSCNIKGTRRNIQKENAIRHVEDVYNLIVNDDEAEAICISEYASKLDIIEED